MAEGEGAFKPDLTSSTAATALDSQRVLYLNRPARAALGNARICGEFAAGDNILGHLPPMGLTE